MADFDILPHRFAISVRAFSSFSPSVTLSVAVLKVGENSGRRTWFFPRRGHNSRQLLFRSRAARGGGVEVVKMATACQTVLAPGDRLFPSCVALMSSRRLSSIDIFRYCGKRLVAKIGFMGDILLFRWESTEL